VRSIHTCDEVFLIHVQIYVLNLNVSLCMVFMLWIFKATFYNNLVLSCVVRFFCLRQSEYPETITNLPVLHVTDKLYKIKLHLVLLVTCRNWNDNLSCDSNRLWVRVMVFNATFNNISVISWRSVLLVEETGVLRENHRPASSHW